ncbi:hypothetical protein BC938DRAFT_475702 [Jimgerdemannia flammicorona]|uniref:Serine-threonine/tyrosine-protein kinase catalytic domain-containing protein n=1 Tax=Jimgerdemannia flammicorona TaxID=994334 RepID=A0A433PPT8_9FUNG|nr:hypothetical protein BC938DRAFT_475702 [Jimgerdemannia flammicorona]
MVSREVLDEVDEGKATRGEEMRGEHYIGLWAQPCSDRVELEYEYTRQFHIPFPTHLQTSATVRRSHRLLEFSKLGRSLSMDGSRAYENSNNLAGEQLILADVYEYGLIMWEIFSDGRRPNEDYDDKEVISLKIQSHLQRLNPLEDIGIFPRRLSPSHTRDT